MTEKKITHLQITFSNGKVFRVPAKYITEHSYKIMKEYNEKYNDDFIKNDYINYMLTDEYALQDWSSNSMDWDDLKDVAVEVKTEAFDYDSMYRESKLEYIMEK